MVPRGNTFIPTPISIITVPNQIEIAWVADFKCWLNERELLQKQPESRHDKAESHEREPRADPPEKRLFSGEIIAHVAIFRSLLRGAHVSRANARGFYTIAGTRCDHRR